LDVTNRKIDEVNAIADEREGPRRLIARITQLDIHELYHDRALAAQRDLVGLSQEHDFQHWMNAEPVLEQGPGGFHRTVFEQHNAWWTRFTIERLADPMDDYAPPLGFKFTTLAERARSAEHSVIIQWSLVDELLQHALNPYRDGVGDRRAMFELLLPPSFKQAAAERRRVVLVVDDKAASYPWELFLERASQGPARIGLLRSLRDHRPQAVSHSAELAALVLGDPTPPNDPDFLQLDGARDEAQHVVNRLRQGGWDLSHSLVRGTADIGTADVLRALFARDYRILHIAGHGVYDPQDPRRSGIIIGTASGDTYAERAASRRLLTPGEIRQLSVIPELVFINCCHLGAIDAHDDSPPQRGRGDRHLLAGNLAAEFIRMGVKAVIAAGWEVDDDAAQNFAETFYDQMLRGEDFGDAVIEARKQAYEAAPDSNTWAAYQCYGNPQFRLVVRDHQARPFSYRRYVDASEAIVDLRNLTAMAHQGKEHTERQCQLGLESILEQLPDAWTERSDVAVALAELHAELGDFQRAIDAYDTAIDGSGEGSNVPIRAIEQRANLRARHAENSAF
ncbi:MAG: CHAT domain-containing protein, partial [Pseudomonadota bacterium]